MYHNIGEKIKRLAKAIFIVETIASMLGGIVLSATNVFIGLSLMVTGPLSGWISSLLIYGFGELIDISRAIEQNTRKGEIIESLGDL